MVARLGMGNRAVSDEHELDAGSGRSARKKDITGRDRLGRNLVARWLGQIVVVISGFVIPRMIDTNLGASALGIWDLGWSTVSYFRLMGLGFAGGLNRFVALYTAQEQRNELRRAVSSTVFLQLAIASITAVVAMTLAWFLPVLFDSISSAEIVDAQWLVAFLGCNLAVRMLFWPSRGILTGHHLWTVTAAVSAAGDVGVLIGLYLVLKLGGGLAGLGLVVFGMAFVTEFVRSVMARKVYGDRFLIWASVDRRMIKKMFVYGMKNNVSSLSSIVAVQTTSMLLAANAGPAALAVYARPLALFNHFERMISQYSFLLTPMAGSIQGLAQDHELREFFLSSMRSSYALSIPAILMLVGFGDAVIEIWMGADYVVPGLVMILGAALFLPFSHAAAIRILAGVNAHGKVALVSLAVTMTSLAIALLIAYQFGWSERMAAVVVGISLTSGPGFVFVIGACRRFAVGAREYFRTSFLPPVLCNLPLAATILAAHWIVADMTFLLAVVSGFAGTIVMALTYWRFLLSAELKQKWQRKLRRKLGKSPKVPQTTE